MTIKEGLYRIAESVILYLTIDFPFRKRKQIKPSLIAINIDWFTNCNWRDQMAAFGHMSNYYAYKH